MCLMSASLRNPRPSTGLLLPHALTQVRPLNHRETDEGQKKCVAFDEQTKQVVLAVSAAPIGDLYVAADAATAHLNPCSSCLCSAGVGRQQGHSAVPQVGCQGLCVRSALRRAAPVGGHLPGCGVPAGGELLQGEKEAWPSWREKKLLGGRMVVLLAPWRRQLLCACPSMVSSLGEGNTPRAHHWATALPLMPPICPVRGI